MKALWKTLAQEKVNLILSSIPMNGFGFRWLKIKYMSALQPWYYLHLRNIHSSRIFLYNYRTNYFWIYEYCFHVNWNVPIVNNCFATLKRQMFLKWPVQLEWWCQNACQLLSDNINWQHESYRHIMYLYTFTSGWHYSPVLMGWSFLILFIPIFIKYWFWKVKQ